MSTVPSIAYAKPLRFPVSSKIASKKYMSMEDAKYLLSGRIAIEEKMDGKSVAFENRHFIFFAEDLKVKHSLRYRVPARYALFDILDKERKMYLGLAGKAEIYRSLKQGLFHNTPLISEEGEHVTRDNFFLVQVLNSGNFTLDDLKPFLAYCSNYGQSNDTLIEGIVAKDIGDMFQGVIRSGKIVRAEFTLEIETHYLRKPTIPNIIDPHVLETNPLISATTVPRTLRYGILGGN